MKDAKERMDGEAPKVIQDWLQFPYEYFADKHGNPTKKLLDIACGNNAQGEMLRSKFESVTSVDNEATGNGIETGDILNINYPDNTFDVVFSFETIEHVGDHDKVKSELLRVTKPGGIVVIGSVNESGPEALDEHVIFKSGMNPYHVKELNSTEWCTFFEGWDISRSEYNNGIWSMEQGANDNGISNYATIEK